MVTTGKPVPVQSGGSTMTETQASPERSTRRLVVTGLVLEAAAVAVGITGLVMWTIAVSALTRQRVARMEVPPSELARRHWARARAATSAGIGAWQSLPVDSRADGVRREKQASRP
jgi:hypothetical protein